MAGEMNGALEVPQKFRATLFRNTRGVNGMHSHHSIDEVLSIDVGVKVATTAQSVFSGDRRLIRPCRSGIGVPNRRP